MPHCPAPGHRRPPGRSSTIPGTRPLGYRDGSRSRPGSAGPLRSGRGRVPPCTSANSRKVLPVLGDVLLPAAEDAGHVMVVVDAQGMVLWRDGPEEDPAARRHGSASRSAPTGANAVSAPTPSAPRWCCPVRSRSTPPNTSSRPIMPGPAPRHRFSIPRTATCSAWSTSAAPPPPSIRARWPWSTPPPGSPSRSSARNTTRAMNALRAMAAPLLAGSRQPTMVTDTDGWVAAASRGVAAARIALPEDRDTERGLAAGLRILPAGAGARWLAGPGAGRRRRMTPATEMVSTCGTPSPPQPEHRSPRPGVGRTGSVPRHAELLLLLAVDTERPDRRPALAGAVRLGRARRGRPGRDLPTAKASRRRAGTAAVPVRRLGGRHGHCPRPARPTCCRLRPHRPSASPCGPAHTPTPTARLTHLRTIPNPTVAASAFPAAQPTHRTRAQGAPMTATLQSTATHCHHRMAQSASRHALAAGDVEAATELFARRQLLARPDRVHLEHRHRRRTGRRPRHAAPRTWTGCSPAVSQVADDLGEPAADGGVADSLDQVRDRGRSRRRPPPAEGRHGWTLLTTMFELKGHEEPSRGAPPQGCRTRREPGSADLAGAAAAGGRATRPHDPALHGDHRRRPGWHRARRAAAAARACRPSSSTATPAPVTPGATATSRCACTTRSGTTTCRTSTSRRTGRSSRRRTRSATGSRCTPR